METKPDGLTGGICKPNAAQEASTEEHALKKLLTKVMNSSAVCAHCQSSFQLMLAAEHR